MTYAVLKKVLRSFAMLLLAGIIIGIWHHEDTLVAVFLALVTLPLLWQTAKKIDNPYTFLLLSAGMIITGFLGVQAELYGIEHGHWSYHDLPDHRHFAHWLPFAWALAFLFLYRLEASLIELLSVRSFKIKLLLTLLISAVLPTWGEVIAINMGVWTYSWPWQFLGVPLLAIVLLMLFHTLIFILFTLLCKKLQIADPVWNNGRYNEPS